MKKCIKMNFLYKGIEISVDGDELERFIKCLNKSYEEDGHLEKYRSYIIVLNHFVKYPFVLSDKDVQCRFCYCVYILSRLGKLKQNKNNGIKFQYEGGI